VKRDYGIIRGMGKRPEIEITNGPMAGKRFAVPKDGLRLGRSSSNDIHIPDEELSRNHCLFEAVGEDGIRLTDLASANGTVVNGRSLGSDSADLKPGDLIEVGATVLKVTGEKLTLHPPRPATPPPVANGENLDLGLGAKPGATTPASPAARRAARLKMAIVVAAVVAVAAVALVLTDAFLSPNANDAEIKSAAADDDSPVLREVVYEKVEANDQKIFRYEMRLSPEGVLSVAVDNVPDEERHVTKSQKLDDAALAELGSILAFSAIRDIDREYIGVEPDPPALESWTLKVVYTTHVRRVTIVNAPEPEAFRAIREKLEAFSKNQLGVWALQYSRDKLVSLADESLALAKAKWEDRDVQYGNLFGAVKAYEEVLFYLETVNPKPPSAAEAQKGLVEAKAELEQRYTNQRFLANRAINLQQWEEAQRQLLVLLELVPDRTDDRNREASAKLIDVEKRLKGEKK
jgi:pSer/pThr/pTyr-binding forkhead associated (FHA) protein